MNQLSFNPNNQKMQDEFNYLLPDQTVRSMPAREQNLWEMQDKKRVRLVYEDCEFDEEQQDQIRQFRRYAQKKQMELRNAPDRTILRYLYSQQFDHAESLQKLYMYLDWYADPNIQRQDHTVFQLINQGVIYTYGRDKSYRPIIYLNVSLLDMDKYSLVDYLAAINLVVTLTVEKMFVKGKMEKYLFVIDVGSKSITSLSLSTVKEMVLKLSHVYSMRMGKLLLINCNTVTKFMYTAVSPFLADTTKHKITILSSSEVQKGKMKQDIHQNQLQTKYGGNLQDLQEKWPPRIPGKQFIATKKITHHLQPQENHPIIFNYENQLLEHKQRKIYGKNVNKSCFGSTKCLNF